MNSIPASAYCLPSPTGELAQGLRDIEEHGFAIVPDVLTGDTLKRAREALYNAADSDAHRERKKKSTGDYDDTNQRVWNVLSRFDPIFWVVQAERYGFVGHSDVSPVWALAVVWALALGLSLWSASIFATGRLKP